MTDEFRTVSGQSTIFFLECYCKASLTLARQGVYGMARN